MEHTIHTLIQSIQPLAVQGPVDRMVTELVFDSRQAKAGSMFFAIRGTQADGHQYVSQVIAAGCDMLVVEESVGVPAHVTCIRVANSAEALGQLASAFYDFPSRELKLVGVTGTNGKTTITTLLYHVFRGLGYPTGLLSTVVNKIDDDVIPSTHTTPNPVALNALLRKMVDAGCAYCFMEVSSHAVSQHRIAGLTFAGGVFSNITHDHLDYHGTFKNYIYAKKGFFDLLPAGAFALVNADDKNGAVMLQNTNATRHTFALKSPADFRAKVIENQFSGLVLNLDGEELWTRLIGDFNAYNLLAVYGVSRMLGQDKIEVLTKLSELQSVEGRFEYVTSPKGITVIVDYAHTPDALENVLKTIANIRTKNETVFTVVGCGGDRDKAKRPEMARIACVWSDQVLLTSDNPRSEDPQVILDEMMTGVEGQHFKKTLAILDRAQAIKTALSMAKPNDIILIAGKGHEKYQEINGVRYDFDDKQVAEELIQKLDK